MSAEQRLGLTATGAYDARQAFWSLGRGTLPDILHATSSKKLCSFSCMAPRLGQLTSRLLPALRCHLVSSPSVIFP